MKNIFPVIIMAFNILTNVNAQETVYPGPVQKETIVLANATIHVGNGQVIQNGILAFSDGKIVEVSASASIADGKLIDCKGKHIYPGLILSSSDLGLVEVRPVRATSDVKELGEYNPNIRALVAYNTDSKVINTLRMNGILMANIV